MQETITMCFRTRVERRYGQQYNATVRSFTIQDGHRVNKTTPPRSSSTLKPYAVAEGGVAAGLAQQQLDDLHVAVLAGAHQGRGALVVLDVDVGPLHQEGPHHVHPAVADRQHEPRLTRLDTDTDTDTDTHTH